MKLVALKSAVKSQYLTIRISLGSRCVSVKLEIMFENWIFLQKKLPEFLE
jgi:hypothetical protein